MYSKSPFSTELPVAVFIKSEFSTMSSRYLSMRFFILSSSSLLIDLPDNVENIVLRTSSHFSFADDAAKYISLCPFGFVIIFSLEI